MLLANVGKSGEVFQVQVKFDAIGSATSLSRAPQHRRHGYAREWRVDGCREQAALQDSDKSKTPRSKRILNFNFASERGPVQCTPMSHSGETHV